MKFQVLSARSLQQLTQVKKTGSNLALGVFYSREGMIPGAEREFQALVRENPGSAVAKKLLVGVQSWQKQPAAENSSSAKNQSAPKAGAREVTVQVTYDENGRVTEASGQAHESAGSIRNIERIAGGCAHKCAVPPGSHSS